MPNGLNLVGDIYGRLSVIARSGILNGERTWVCSCECGGVSIVKGSNLRTGNTRSCGCLALERQKEAKKARPSYRGQHHRLIQEFGPAKNHRCIDCGRIGSHWSLNVFDEKTLRREENGSPVVYSLDSSNYVPRCDVCHKTHDVRESGLQNIFLRDGRLEASVQVNKKRIRKSFRLDRFPNQASARTAAMEWIEMTRQEKLREYQMSYQSVEDPTFGWGYSPNQED